MTDVHAHTFTQQLQTGDLVVQPYGSRWSLGYWAGTYYDYFDVRNEHPCREDAAWTLRFQQEQVEVWHRIQKDPTVGDQPTLTDEQFEEIAAFEQMCEQEYQAVQTAQAHSILLYAVVGNRLAIPIRFLAPNKLSPDWYSPRKFATAEQASQAFLERYPGAVQISAEMLEEASEQRLDQAGLSR